MQMANNSQNKNQSQSKPISILDGDQNYFQTADDMIKFMQLGYFYTIENAYRTWNYDIGIIQSSSNQIIKDQSEDNTMKQESEEDKEKQTIYLPQAFLIGNIHKLQTIEMKTKQGSISFYKTSLKTTYDNKMKSILLTLSSYRTTYVKSFNRMMRNKNQKYLFTNLKPIYHKKSNEWQLYFMLSPSSHIIHVTDQLYNLQFKPIDRIIDQDFNFSNIKLSKIYSVDQLDKNCKDGFMITQIKQRFEARQKQSFTLVGVINILEKPQYDKGMRGKKQLTLLVTQVLYRPSRHCLIEGTVEENHSRIKCNEIGRCKLIIRYLSSDEEYIENLIFNNHTYLFSDLEILVTENVNIIYLLNVPKNNSKNLCIFRISQQPMQGINFGNQQLTKRHNYFSLLEIQNLFGINLESIKISNLLQKNIHRNLVKLQVGLLQIQIIYGSIRCSKCGMEVKRNNQLLSFETMGQQQQLDKQILLQIQCHKSHQQYHALKLWGTVRAADDTGSCLISLQHKQIMSFLQLHQYYDAFENYVRKNGRGITIMTSNKEKSKSQQEDPLFNIKNRIRKKYLEKVIIGFAKTQLDKTFRDGLTQDEQMEFQGSFQNAKKYLQQKKIFPNGIIQKKSEQILLLPFIKSLQVTEIS